MQRNPIVRDLKHGMTDTMKMCEAERKAPPIFQWIWATAILFFGAGCSIAADGRDATAGLAGTGGGFGICTSAESSGNHARLYPRLAEAGVTMIRSWPEWQGVQPRQGEWNWQAVDGRLASARRNGLEPLGIFGYFAKWASVHGSTRQHPLKDMAYWREYVARTVERYKDNVRYWEIWNEFNTPGFGGNGTPADYAALVSHAYDAAKRVDPEAQIGISCASVDVGFFEDAIQAGAAGKFDFVCVHPYEHLGSALRGRETVFLTIADTVRDMLARNDQPTDIPIWVTEIGHKAKTGNAESERQQAEALAKAYLLSFAQGIERVFWFEGKGDVYKMGILRKDWTPRPSYIVLDALTDALGPMPEPIGWYNPTGKSYGFAFAGENEPVLAMWAISEKGDTIRFDAPVVVRDMAGNETRLATDRDLQLKRMPVLLTDLPADLVAAVRENHGKPFPWIRDYSEAEVVTCGMDVVNVEYGLSQLERGDGKTVVGMIGGHYARRSDKQGGHPYVYFDVHDSYADADDPNIEITVVARRVKTLPGKNVGFKILYESQGGDYKSNDHRWIVPEEDTWHTYTFPRLTDASFANKWGWNFRFELPGSAGDVWIREVRVKRIEGD